ncbi:MAG: chemotaxis protein CheW [Candidatus Competibacteraceae bacterium]|nr:chemotaxis protein CheW [Candidatus Competibacteraceae bacterium]
MTEAVMAPSAAPSAPHPFDILLQLDERVRQRAPAEAASAQLSEIRGQLASRLGSWNLLFSMDDVAEIIPFPRSITQVPGVKRWLMGIANLRGKVISVSDLRDFLTGRASARLPGCQIVVVRGGEWDYGLLMDEIIGMRHFGSQHRLPSLDEVEEGLRPLIVEAFWSDDQRWMVFNTRKLLAEPQFLNAAS